MRTPPDDLVHHLPGDDDRDGRPDGAPGGSGAAAGRTAPPVPLDAGEDDPDAASTAALPGYSAGGAGDGEAAVGAPAQDQHPA